MRFSLTRLSPALIRTTLYALIFGVQAISIIVAPANGYAWFSLAFLTARWVAVYFFHVGVLNRFLGQRQLAGLLIGAVGTIIVFIATRYVIEEIVYPATLGVRNYDPSTTLWRYATDNLYYATPSLVIGLVLKLAEDWFLHQRERTELLTEKKTAELAFLKSQVNPHFLFNTLNNIYSLAYTKSDEAPGAILKLAELMRYMIYDNAGKAHEGLPGTAHKVPLTKEIEHLNNFVELEKLRVAQAQVHWQTDGNMDLYRIEPLILLSFVENAFKHGDLTDPAHPLVIDLSVRQGKLIFDTINKKARRQKDAVGGIGLQNVRRRLDLLYPNQYTLRIDDTADTYACRLELSL